ncbi:MAG: uracil-DNA glycosylase, partial [Alphaproteobacteria bacterium]
DWHNGAVPSFGALEAQLLIVGLAPGLRGANRTGRPFTGDFAGDLLFETLEAFGFAAGTYGRVASDGLRLVDSRLTNAVRCVPPANKPKPEEFARCQQFLAREIGAMPRLAAILALGRNAHERTLAALGLAPRSRWPFRHGAFHELPVGLMLADSYHCSRQNTNTGRLNPAMFRSVVGELRARLDRRP